MTPRSLWIVVLLAACGSQATSNLRAHETFSADDAALFEDGVDLIDNPDQLEGQWKADWDRDLDRRVAQSDVVAIGSVTTLRDEVDLDHKTNYQIVLAIEKVLEGTPPSKELNLTSRQGATGYPSVEEHRANLLGRKFVAFVRYVKATEGDALIVAHFHLSTPSETVNARLSAFNAQKKKPARAKLTESPQ